MGITKLYDYTNEEGSLSTLLCQRAGHLASLIDSEQSDIGVEFL